MIITALLVISFAAQAVTPAKPIIIFIPAHDPGINGLSCSDADSHKPPQMDKPAASDTRSETAQRLFEKQPT